ncbi:MAG TPA: FAD binding domain-containing protein [Acetobacteraceae bacterium]|nr:FAD binding domain-containing protein [Acetobacteraceae bacterium]
MKPAPLAYLRACSAEEALEALHQEGSDVRILAGGQSLIPMLNMRLARPALLVDVMHIPALQSIDADATRVTIGAAVRQCAIEAWPALPRRLRLLAAALPWVGHIQTRSRGTLCGSVAHADPSAEIPLVLVALGGLVHLRSHRGARRLPAAAFCTGMMATACEPDEMIEAISLPSDQPGTGYAFREIGRRHGDFAIVACAAVATANGATLAVGGVADRPMARSFALPATPGDAAALDDALDAFAWDLDARDDLHATARYRRELVRRLGRIVIEEAAQGRAVIEEAARCRA